MVTRIYWSHILAAKSFMFGGYLWHFGTKPHMPPPLAIAPMSRYLLSYKRFCQKSRLIPQPVTIVCTQYIDAFLVITGPPNGLLLICSLASVVVCNAAGERWGNRRARGRSGGRHCTAGQYGYDPLTTPCYKPHRMQAVHKMLQTSYVALSVCLSAYLCWAH